MIITIIKQLDIYSYIVVDWSAGQSTLARKATAENPAGSGILPRKLKRCPRKATAWSENQQSSYVGVYGFCVKNNNSENKL
ncbi:hypothetical protein GH741_16255 [Aquibacillus halophilus]|uniref:Uncharacterized protein n=1 Tax=Aquibacillus halophilus TaxID=930132 RepID=A0A6A8DI56_9BACI|nr:hypothetical protein [Aquibacillus halophilus]MRH44196.1 hypothetical protein [Aquibacillus halophilus]